MKLQYALDERNNYSFHMDYCEDFFDPCTCGLAMRNMMERDFLHNLSGFLASKVGVEKGVAWAVASSVLARMSTGHLHYHSPVHVLAMFLFAARLDMELKPWEQLAIWFHDVVYTPGAPENYNEQQSANFMRAVLPSGLDAPLTIVGQAERGILFTAMYEREDVEEQFHRIMDLDLVSFSCEYKKFCQIALLVQKEMLSAYTERRFKTAHRRFLQRMLAKKHIYRTSLFQEKFEETARANMTRFIKD